MSIKSNIYIKSPELIRNLLKSLYKNIRHNIELNERQLQFVDDFFNSRGEYYEYIEEFYKSSAIDLRMEGREEYQKLTGNEQLGGISIRLAADYYAIVRKLKPEVVVETGVCNGISSLSVLLALRKNKLGKLYSIDYPLRESNSLEEFKKETFGGNVGATIPSDKEPGWIIPHELSTRWELIIGKSQRELPRLLTALETLDMFIHDSDHSHPCMMFEYELAYEWLEPGGMILSDDITCNDAFPTFIEAREAKYCKIMEDVGYIEK